MGFTPAGRIGEVTQSIVGSNSDPYLPDANITQLLGIEEQTAVCSFFFVWDVFCRFRFLFFFGQMVNKKILLKSSKKGFWSREALFSGPGFCLSFEVLPDPGGQQAREHAFGRQWTAPRRKNGWVLKKPRSTRGGRVPQNVGSGWVYPVWRIQNVGQKLVVFFK